MYRLMTVLAAGAAITGGSAQAQADLRGAAPPPGDYWRTCQNVSTYGFGRDAVVSAQCRDNRGRLQSTSLRFDGCNEIDNRNGQLVCLSSGGGNGGGGPRPPWGGDNGGGGGPRPPWGGDSGNGGGPRPPWGGGGRSSITIYGGADYRGQMLNTEREVTNLPRQYNDRTMSLRIEGRGAWQVCSDKNFRGRCQVFDRSVSDLRSYGLGEAVTSMRPVDQGYDRPYDRPY